jgi:hypothetical protein
MKWLAQVGAGIIAAALVLTYMEQVKYALICLLVAGIIDLVLELKYKDDPTISQWIHTLFPKKIDVGIVIGLLAASWWVFGPVGFLPVCIGVIIGHLFWQENQDD